MKMKDIFNKAGHLFKKIGDYGEEQRQKNEAHPAREAAVVGGLFTAGLSATFLVCATATPLVALMGPAAPAVVLLPFISGAYGMNLGGKLYDRITGLDDPDIESPAKQEQADSGTKPTPA